MPATPPTMIVEEEIQEAITLSGTSTLEEVMAIQEVNNNNNFRGSNHGAYHGRCHGFAPRGFLSNAVDQTSCTWPFLSI